MSYFDDNEDYIIYGRGRATRRAPRDEAVFCNRCGKGPLHWDDDGDGKPVLMEDRFKVHKCTETDLHARAADDFEALE